MTNEENIIVNNLKRQYISTKEDKFENEISWFKIIDKNMETKFLIIKHIISFTIF
jgi:uncharacterized protein YnzC (UPF0291/DUF896 family)